MQQPEIAATDRPVYSEGGFEGFGRTPLFRPVTIAHASEHLTRGVATRTSLSHTERYVSTYVRSATNHTRCMRARCEEDIDRSDNVMSTRDIRAFFGKRKAAEQDGKVLIL